MTTDPRGPAHDTARGRPSRPPHWRDRAWARASAVIPPLGSHGTRGELMQIVKAVVAGVLARLVAGDLLGLESAFLAPWTALLTVHATVYRSLTRGSRVVGATVLGVLVSYLVVELAGYSALALGVAMLVGMLAGLLRPIRNEGSTVATTALFVITAGQAEQAPMLVDRLSATGIGVAAGLVVNALLLAPLNDLSARRQIDSVCRRLGTLITKMADELPAREDVDAQGWIQQSRETDAALGRARELVRHTREAGFANPRRMPEDSGPSDYEALLLRLEEGIAQTRAIARTIDRADGEHTGWSEQFCRRWLHALAALGDQLDHPREQAPSQRPELESLVSDLSSTDLSRDHWLAYGSLIDSTLHISDVVDDITGPRRVSV
uniref:Aromatic acid exporter family protein n=1 Tax=Janibacter limosus TaxID=53458 RepID=A0AC61U7T5_9MICO|nr:aromatic acid exporter family protein [Janibacter limosus]